MMVVMVVVVVAAAAVVVELVVDPYGIVVMAVIDGSDWLVS